MTKARSNKPRFVPSFPNLSEEVKATARVTLHPGANAAAVVAEYGKAFGAQNMTALTEALMYPQDLVADDDLGPAEEMLLGQAHALQAIFVNLARRAVVQEYQSQLESFLRLALKAQNQCRATLETLATLKNPMAGAYVRQQNVAVNQQINNTPATSMTEARAREKFPEQSKLLEVENGQRLDTRAAATTGIAYTNLATVATVDGTQNGER